MQPKKQKKIKFINSCDCLVDYDLLERAMLWFSAGNLKSPRKIYMHGRYPAVSIFDKKIHIHRLILLYINKGMIVDKMVAHHKDENRRNSQLENLELLSSSIHAKHHNKGKTLSEEHKRKIAEAGKRRKGIKLKKRVNVDLQALKDFLSRGYSINKIAKIFGCDWSTIKSRIHENPELLEG